MPAIKSKVESHKKEIENLLFKVDNTNVLDCIDRLANLYSNIALGKVSFRQKNG